MSTLGYNGSDDANDEAKREKDEVSKHNIETQTNGKNKYESPEAILTALGYNESNAADNE